MVNLWPGRRADESVHERLDRHEDVLAKLVHLFDQHDVNVHDVELPNNAPVVALTPDQAKIAELEARLDALSKSGVTNSDVTPDDNKVAFTPPTSLPFAQTNPLDLSKDGE